MLPLLRRVINILQKMVRHLTVGRVMNRNTNTPQKNEVLTLQGNLPHFPVHSKVTFYYADSKGTCNIS